MKLYRFFYHFNKPLSKQRGKPYMSVHFRGKCYFARRLSCHVSCQTKERKTQPVMVMQGYCREVIDNNGIIQIV